MTERWYGPFPTPNVAGVECAAGALLVLTVVSAACHWQTRWRWVVITGCAFAALAALVGLAASGSRAGALALIIGLAGLVWQRALDWRLASSAVGFALLVALFSAMGGRVVEGLAVDASIADRLRLWWATCACIGDHPWSGTPAVYLPGWIDAWYLPSALAERFASPLNAVLDIALSAGIPAAGLAVALVAWPLALAGDAQARGQRIVAGAAALALAQVTGAMFQAHQRWWPYALVMGLSLGMTAIAALARPEGRLVRARLAAWRALGVGAATSLGLTALALWAAHVHPWRTQRVDGHVLVQPRHATAWAAVVLATDHPTELERTGQAWAHAALADGAEVVLVERGGDALAAAVAGRGVTHPVAAVAFGDVAARVWRGDIGLGPHVLGVVIDPTGLPGVVTGKRLVITARAAPFVPTRMLRARVPVETERIIVLPTSRVDPVEGWALVAAELRRR